MHILEIPSFFPPLGGEFCIEQSKALKALGHEVRILACVQLGITVKPKLYFTARRGRWTIEADVEIYKTFMRGIPHNTRYNQRHWCKIVLSMYEDYKKRYGKPDVIHAHCCQWAGVAARMISENEGIPFYITEHLSSILYEKGFGKGWTKNLWAKDLLKDTFESAYCVVPVSEELVDDLAPLFGKEYKYKVISNIIDVNFFAFKEREKREGRPFKFCCLARADIYGKGYDVLAKAMKELPDIELHIAGRDTTGEEMKALFGNMKNVTLHGELDKRGVRELLYQCDALVLASRCEAQPLVLLEAMATGIPVVSTECTPQIERIQGACLIAQIGDEKGLAECMRRVMDIDPSADISKAVREIASPESVAKKLSDVLSGK